MSAVIETSAWIDICALTDVPRRGARRIAAPRGPIALFRTGDDAVFALLDRCPHKNGPLSMGLVHGHSVTCPLHAWVIDLASGEPLGADSGKGCAPRIGVRVERGRILLDAAALKA
jgi:nitrite reductase (NADH) small subunit